MRNRDSCNVSNSRCSNHSNLAECFLEHSSALVSLGRSHNSERASLERNRNRRCMELNNRVLVWDSVCRITLAAWGRQVLVR